MLEHRTSLDEVDAWMTWHPYHILSDKYLIIDRSESTRIVDLSTCMYKQIMEDHWTSSGLFVCTNDDTDVHIHSTKTGELKRTIPIPTHVWATNTFLYVGYEHSIYSLDSNYVETEVTYDWSDDIRYSTCFEELGLFVEDATPVVLLNGAAIQLSPSPIPTLDFYIASDTTVAGVSWRNDQAFFCTIGSDSPWQEFKHPLGEMKDVFHANGEWIFHDYNSVYAGGKRYKPCKSLQWSLVKKLCFQGFDVHMLLSLSERQLLTLYVDQLPF